MNPMEAGNETVVVQNGSVKSETGKIEDTSSSDLESLRNADGSQGRKLRGIPVS